MVSTLSTKTHKTLHHAETDEAMVCSVSTAPSLDSYPCVRSRFSSATLTAARRRANTSWASATGVASTGSLLLVTSSGTFASRSKRATVRRQVTPFVRPLPAGRDPCQHFTQTPSSRRPLSAILPFPLSLCSNLSVLSGSALSFASFLVTALVYALTLAHTPTVSTKSYLTIRVL